MVYAFAVRFAVGVIGYSASSGGFLGVGPLCSTLIGMWLAQKPSAMGQAFHPQFGYGHHDGYGAYVPDDSTSGLRY